MHLRHITVAIGTRLGRFPLVNPAIAQRHVFPLKMGLTESNRSHFV
jgi:hypothetical protein